MAGKTSAENGKKGGRPKGRKNEKTIQKELEMDYFRRRVSEAMAPIVNAQLALAQGLSFLYKIEKKRIEGPKGGVRYEPQRPKLVTNRLEIEDYLSGLIDSGDVDDESDHDATYYYITTEKPENEAIKDILNRAFGKPKESLDITSGGKSFAPDQVTQQQIDKAVTSYMKHGN